jgi:methylthioribose-1-phosphate isomerase
MCLGLGQGASDADIHRIAGTLIACRPTAVNLRWAVQRMSEALLSVQEDDRIKAAYAEAGKICEEDVAVNEAIGVHGLKLIQEAWDRIGGQGEVRILTHCNAGWLATVDWGTALAPVYKAHDAGIPLHVWVDETRPRSQGAALTAWELEAQGISHSLIVDNAGGHLMQHGQVDQCIEGTDRTTASGDGRIEEVRIAPEGTPAANPAFDVTPSSLVTGLITERGVCPASREGLGNLYPEMV